MVGITKMLYGAEYYGDRLRYSNHSRNIAGAGPGGPVVVWNSTQSCNLKCVHCYADSYNCNYAGELSTMEAEQMIDDLAQLNVPVLLISGGEPLMRSDILHLIKYAGSKGIRCTLSTNGTFIDEQMAFQLKQAAVSYVGISLDGIGDFHDSYRGVKGSFEKALSGIRNCISQGQKVGLRYTMSRPNITQLPQIFKLIQDEKIQRVCFYHLVYSGRGSGMMENTLSAQEIRSALDAIIAQARVWGPSVEVLTVDNHADGVYVYQQEKASGTERENDMAKLLALSGGNRSGMAIGCIGPKGDVHPDQFSWAHKLGNVRDVPFSTIWTTDAPLLLRQLRSRKTLLKGRCGSCGWIEQCNGNLRVRAEALTGDFWAEDPACYLSDDEINRRGARP